MNFAIAKGPFEGRMLRADCWLTKAAMPFSKNFLETVGFGKLKPSEIGQFSGFMNLPLVLAKVGTTEFEGRNYPEIQRLIRTEPRPPGEDWDTVPS